jgi:hypothetical protein
MLVIPGYNHARPFAAVYKQFFWYYPIKKQPTVKIKMRFLYILYIQKAFLSALPKAAQGTINLYPKQWPMRIIITVDWYFSLPA